MCWSSVRHVENSRATGDDADAFGLPVGVQCNQRVAIVEAIKTLPVEVQEAIAMKIKEVI